MNYYFSFLFREYNNCPLPAVPPAPKPNPYPVESINGDSSISKFVFNCTTMCVFLFVSFYYIVFTISEAVANLTLRELWTKNGFEQNRWLILFCCCLWECIEKRRFRDESVFFYIYCVVFFSIRIPSSFHSNEYFVFSLNALGIAAIAYDWTIKRWHSLGDVCMRIFFVLLPIGVVVFGDAFCLWWNQFSSVQFSCYFSSRKTPTLIVPLPPVFSPHSTLIPCFSFLIRSDVQT